MGSARETNPSMWLGSEPAGDPRASLEGTVRTDVAVVGAGIAGLTTAALLVRAGAQVVLLEAGRLACGVTGFTTAKVTSLHGLSYAKLASSFGDEGARTYGEANQAALQLVASLVEEFGIDCNFRRADAYTYTERDDLRTKIEEEVDVARRIGLPADFLEETALPFRVRGAVRFADQAMFHPRRYCLGLAGVIDRSESMIYERTRVVDVEEQDGSCVLTTAEGSLQADRVVLATHLPFPQQGKFYAKTFPSRSYASAYRTDDLFDGMFLSAEEPVRSVRPHEDETGRYLLVGGEGHRVGQDDDTRIRYDVLAEWAGERFGLEDPAYRWSAQDYMPADGVPYIGRISGDSERVFVATGFNKWGMTLGTVAGMILTDALTGKDNPWATFFDATRIDAARSAKRSIKENVDAGRDPAGDRLKSRRAPSLDELARGDGAIVDVGGQQVAAYLDPDGKMHAVSPTCTHMGCLVAFNTAEKSWDCPCHGSRFDVQGRVIQGPAVEDLASVDIDDLPHDTEGPDTEGQADG